mmetsp:Transcript_32641/g.70078  ORF Transcript_32641/g.70078 Transcript_32641/m.70078 type:complete len:152 (+) Transcript_32641:841-1296(+)
MVGPAPFTSGGKSGGGIDLGGIRPPVAGTPLAPDPELAPLRAEFWLDLEPKVVEPAVDMAPAPATALASSPRGGILPLSGVSESGDAGRPLSSLAPLLLGPRFPPLLLPVASAPGSPAAGGGGGVPERAAEAAEPLPAPLAGRLAKPPLGG